MKNIIHMKLPLIERCGQYDIAVKPEVVHICISNTRETVGPEYAVIATPFDTTCINGDAKVINIDCKEYSYNELLAIIAISELWLEENKVKLSTVVQKVKERSKANEM